MTIELPNSIAEAKRLEKPQAERAPVQRLVMPRSVSMRLQRFPRELYIARSEKHMFDIF